MSSIKDWFKGDAYKVDGFIYKADDVSNSKNLILYEEKERLFLKDEGDWIVFSFDSDDEIQSGKGNDFFNLGAGNDLLINTGGNAIAYGGSGNDELITLTSQDFIDFKIEGSYIGGKVTFYGEEGDDVLGGGDGDDILDGGPGNDMIFGKGGDDQIFTGTGEDKVYAGPGNDKIFINSTGAANEIRGGPGDDQFIILPFEPHPNERILYLMLDFELENKNEKIDFSNIPYVHSLSDLSYVGGITVTIDPEMVDSRGGLLEVIDKEQRTEQAIGACWIYKETEKTYHCVVLPGVTMDDINNDSFDSFVFN